jgi:hypothetical protein
MPPLTISSTSPPLPRRRVETLGERLACVRTPLDPAEELQPRSDPLARLEIELRQLQRLLDE